jgi:hypothetical protein
MAWQAIIPYALAAYGGYKGYKASKEAGGSGLQRLLAGATGAALGYYGGKMIPGVQLRWNSWWFHTIYTIRTNAIFFRNFCWSSF